MLTEGGVMKKRSSPIKPRWRQAPLAVALQPLCQRWRRVYKTRHHQHPWHVFNYHFKAHGKFFKQIHSRALSVWSHDRPSRTLFTLML